MVCPGLRYFSCQTPSGAWKVAETVGGIQVTSATDAAYVGFAVDPNTEPALVAHDIDATLAALGITVTHSSLSGVVTSFSGRHLGTPIRGAINESRIGPSTGIAIEWANADSWRRIKPTLERIHASIEYQGA
jgi:hypothetical protein